MTALTEDTSVARLGLESIPSKVEYGVSAGATIYAGALCMLDASGYITRAASGDAESVVVGRAERLADNNLGGAADIDAEVKQGIFRFVNDSGTPLTIADRMQPCYVLDDATVSGSDGGSVRPIAGIVYDVTSAGVDVLCVGSINRSLVAAASGAVPSKKVWGVRGASTANVAALATFTVANDGIVLAEGDLVLLKNQAAPAENGIYEVGAVAVGVAPLTRYSDYDDAIEIKPNDVVTVSEGTANADSAWELMANEAIVVGVTALDYAQVPFAYGVVGDMSTASTVAADAGTAFEAARIDHRHLVETATVDAIDTEANNANAEGTSDELARADHAHKFTMASSAAGGRAAAAVAGQLHFTTDTNGGGVFYDNGATWDQISWVLQEREVQFTSADLVTAGNTQTNVLGAAIPATAMILGYTYNLVDAFDSPGAGSLDVQLGDDTTDDDSLCAAFDAYTASANEGAGLVQGTRGAQPNGPPTGAQLEVLFTSTVDNLDTFTNGDLTIRVIFVDFA
jgi:hypothetical protein